MGIFSNVLFAADYDLTITARDGSIPDANVAAVRRFIEGGGIFTVATGRSRSPLAGDPERIMTNAPHIVEAQCIGTSKGIAARKLAELFGRSVLVCAGDAKNDLSMLKEADLAYVPADGDSSLFAYGFRTAAACSDGAIASIVEDLAASAAGKEGI